MLLRGIRAVFRASVCLRAGEGAPAVGPIYLVLVLVGVVRAFNQPTTHALLPQIVPEELFPSAVAWGQTGFQGAIIIGPALGGLIYALAHGPAVVYASSMVAFILAIVGMAQIRVLAKPPVRRDISVKTMLAGLSYVWQQKVLLGSISLDLFAVLLGGATALLPVYAKEILHTGPWGLGLLRSAPGVGATVMALVVAHLPVQRRAGATMLWCVAGFGVFTIVFGLSRNLCPFPGRLISVRRQRYGERDHPRHPGAGVHAGRDARARHRREFAVRGRQQ